MCRRLHHQPAYHSTGVSPSSLARLLAAAQNLARSHGSAPSITIPPIQPIGPSLTPYLAPGPRPKSFCSHVAVVSSSTCGSHTPPQPAGFSSCHRPRRCAAQDAGQFLSYEADPRRAIAPESGGGVRLSSADSAWNSPSVRSVRGAQNGIFCRVGIFWRMRGKIQKRGTVVPGHDRYKSNLRDRRPAGFQRFLLATCTEHALVSIPCAVRR